MAFPIPRVNIKSVKPNKLRYLAKTRNIKGIFNNSQTNA